MKDAIVLYPALERGHLMSTVELGKLIATHHPSLSITIPVLTPPSGTPLSTKQYLSAVASDAPSISFRHLPPIPLPSYLPPQAVGLELCRHSNPNLRHLLESISRTSNLKAVVLDFLNYTAAEVTSALSVPTYYYYTSGAHTLSVFLQLPRLHQTTTKSIKDFQTILIPGLDEVPTSEFPDAVQVRGNPIHKIYMDMARSMIESDGVIINTFEGMEGRAIKALNDGLCLPGVTSPPFFGVGPVITTVTCGDQNDENGCLAWLDSQPRQSVVFLCFGSLGRFSKKQIAEIAAGLEESGQRFLWVVRSDSADVASLEELLPEGFLERTKEKGMVVLNWAPQAAILSHGSVGGFVTHCGWNSVLEAVCEGVPMVTWPLYAEQKLNRVVMVKEMKVALALSESSEGLVSGSELAERVKEMMESEKGKEMRKRLSKMRMEAKEATQEKGSSLVALTKLTQLWAKKLACSVLLESPTSVMWAHKNEVSDDEEDGEQS